MLTRTKIIKMMLLIPFLRPARLSSLYLASVEDVFSVVQGAKKQLHQPNIKIMKTTNQHQYKHPNQFRSQQQQQQEQKEQETTSKKQEAINDKRQTTNNNHFHHHHHQEEEEEALQEEQEEQQEQQEQQELPQLPQLKQKDIYIYSCVYAFEETKNQ